MLEKKQGLTENSWYDIFLFILTTECIPFRHVHFHDFIGDTALISARIIVQKELKMSF